MSNRIKGSYDLVFIVYSNEMASMDQQSMSRLIEEQLSEAGVING